MSFEQLYPVRAKNKRVILHWCIKQSILNNNWVIASIANSLSCSLRRIAIKLKKYAKMNCKKLDTLLIIECWIFS